MSTTKKDPYYWRTHPKSPCAQSFNVQPRPNKRSNSKLVRARR